MTTTTSTSSTLAPPPPAPRRTRAVVLAVAVALLALAGGLAALALRPPAAVDPAAAQSEIGRLTRTAVGVDPLDVRCPTGVTARPGATFTCTAMVDTEPVTYWVSQDDDRGHLSVVSDRLLRLDAVAGAVAAKLSADLRVAWTVRCGPSGRAVVANTPGQDVDCTATRAGRSMPLAAVVAEDGTTRYRLT